MILELYMFIIIFLKGNHFMFIIIFLNLNINLLLYIYITMKVKQNKKFKIYMFIIIQSNLLNLQIFIFTIQMNLKQKLIKLILTKPLLHHQKSLFIKNRKNLHLLLSHNKFITIIILILMKLILKLIPCMFNNNVNLNKEIILCIIKQFQNMLPQEQWIELK